MLIGHGQWNSIFHAKRKSKQTKTRLTGFWARDLGFLQATVRIQHDEEQTSQILESNTSIKPANNIQSKSNHGFDQIKLNSMKQAQTYSHIKFQLNITSTILDHFQWFKAQSVQREEIYTKHGMILRNGRVEFLPNLENSCDSMVIWLYALETDAPGGSKCWLDSSSWLKLAWLYSKWKLPWMRA
jgi:hypothetical protein